MKYVSPNSNEECTAAQLIAEIIVTREGTKRKIIMPYKFWNLPEWKKKYRSQIFAANKLLKQYSPVAILNALKRVDCQRQYSLRANGISEAIFEEQRKLNTEKELIKKSVEASTNNPDEFRQIDTGQKSTKSRLD